MKLGIALGGGGARGLAHIGVLKSFQNHGIPISKISGTSIGAFVGGLYAVFRDASKVEDFIYDFVGKEDFVELNLDAFDPAPNDKQGYLKTFLNTAYKNLSIFRSWRHQSMLSNEQVEKIFSFYPNDNIEDLAINTGIDFAAVTTDLISGRETILSSGSLRQAVLASSSIPGIFPPVKMLGTLMCDGGVADLVPVYVSRSRGAQLVVAVDVTKSLNEQEDLSNGLKIIDRAQTILSYQLSRERLAGADIVIRPSSTRFSWASVRHMPEIIKSGEDAAEKIIPALKEMMR